MTALFIQDKYIKIDCDKCGDETAFIKVENPVYDNDTIKKSAVTICRECLKK